MKKLNIGDKGQAICETCETIVSTTYTVRDIILSESKIVVPNLLVGVCDKCNHTVSIPAQNTEEIKKIREENNL